MRLVAPTQTYTLRLTVEACCELEDRTEQDFDALTQQVQRGRVTAVRWVLWAALQAKHARTFPDPVSVSGLIDELGGARAIRSVLTAFLLLNADDDPLMAEGKGQAAAEERPPGRVWRRLYLEARCQGLRAEDFWRLSLRELWREMAAIRLRAKQERDRDVIQAWYIALLVWQTRLPPLESLVSDKPERRGTKQTWQEMKAAMKAITSAIDVNLAPTKGMSRGE